MGHYVWVSFARVDTFPFWWHFFNVFGFSRMVSACVSRIMNQKLLLCLLMIHKVWGRWTIHTNHIEGMLELDLIRNLMFGDGCDIQDRYAWGLRYKKWSSVFAF